MSAKLLSYLEFKNKWRSSNKNGAKEIPWGFSTVYVNSDIKLIFNEWVELMFAFDQLDADSRLDAAIVSIRKETGDLV